MSGDQVRESNMCLPDGSHFSHPYKTELQKLSLHNNKFLKLGGIKQWLCWPYDFFFLLIGHDPALGSNSMDLREGQDNDGLRLDPFVGACRYWHIDTGQVERQNQF